MLGRDGGELLIFSDRYRGDEDQTIANDTLSAANADTLYRSEDVLHSVIGLIAIAK